MNIIIDTREKQPWQFTKASPNIIFEKLDTGDYSIEGFTDILCIERKKSVAELAGNIVSKRFERELERMSKFQYKFLILEFDYNHIDDFPEGSNIPKHQRAKIRVKGSFIIKRLAEIQIKYNIHILPCSNTTYAEHVAYSLMKEIYNC